MTCTLAWWQTGLMGLGVALLFGVVFLLVLVVVAADPLEVGEDEHRSGSIG